MAIQDDLQSLIADLERILWEGQLSDNREVSTLLERVRYYLLTRQFSENSENYDQKVEKLTEIILTRLETHITDWLKPLGNDLENFRNQRQSLLQEIQQLEQQRQKMMGEFLQGLTRRCTELLQDSLVSSQQSSQGLELEHQLDSRLKTIFSTLGQDLQSYSESLAEGLERMHNLGQQGEAKFLAYCNRLQEQLEITLRQPTLEGSNTQLNPIIESSPQRYYLGLNLAWARLNVVLVQINPNHPEESLIYPLEGSFNSLSGLVSINPMVKDLSKEALIGIKEALIPQMTDLTLELAGIMVICPSQWTENDRTQWQDILLENDWISTGEQIIWVDQAIALVVSLLSPSEKVVPTLVLTVGQQLTQLALVKAEDDLPSLMTQKVNYGLESLDQDIFSQLIEPQWRSQLSPDLPPLRPPFPQAGQPDLSLRKIFSQQLQEHPLGDAFLEAAKLTRLILQHQESFTTTLGQQSWGVTRQELNEKIIDDWIQQLEPILNNLLAELSENSLEQVIINGEEIETITSILSPWLQEKLPQTTIISQPNQETDLTQAFIYVGCFL
ncbi:hypothetical protein PCC8801_0889 [Rippkaea orientalis PCC 8801]|uniref:Uncharacterized protein n=1 Tax=Rippkaea orientalis (strain PCC 8801 / RF-1) TaxID=41431 RepID=B7JZM4_RIPO1|nr:hypothetical protein [Rippkaea orientalis]ACK64967.1 hypothetical protein PCC8801_0889 [Rippkaea orientalis PCC 8801]